MRELYQRLKELDRDRFEQLCFHLINAKYPSAHARRVEGKAGDEGADSFAGRLDGKPVVWQAKSFLSGIGDSQRNQIRESLNRALSCISPRIWVLCVSVDLDVNAHRWYQQLARKHKKRVDLRLMAACDIVHDLLYHQSIREAFFPGAVIDMLELQKMLSGRTGLSLEDLASISADNVEQYLREIERLDPRFAYDVRFTRNRVTDLHRSTQPGLIASISDGTKVIGVFGRDIEALRLSPPGGKLRLSREGLKKMECFQRTGRPQSLGPQELLGFTSEFDFLLPRTAEGNRFSRMEVTHSPGTLPSSIPMRLTLGEGRSAVVYKFLEFAVTRLGTEEAELLGRGSMPFEFRLNIAFGGRVECEFLQKFEDADFRDILQLQNGLRGLGKTGMFELFDLRNDRVFLKGTIDSGSLQKWPPHFENWVEAMCQVSQRYDVVLRFADEFSESDRLALIYLKGFIDGIFLPITGMSFELIKDENLDLSRLCDAGPGSFLIVLPEFPQKLSLLGVDIQTGPVLFQVDKARVKDAFAMRDIIANARNGAPIPVCLECESEVWVARHTPEALKAEPAA